MISITSAALGELMGFLRGRKAAPSVRVVQPPAACGGGNELALTVDTPREFDFSTTAGELTIAIRRDLLEQTGKVTIDYRDNGAESGFVVETERLLPPSVKDCTGCAGCG